MLSELLKIKNGIIKDFKNYIEKIDLLLSKKNILKSNEEGLIFLKEETYKAEAEFKKLSLRVEEYNDLLSEYPEHKEALAILKFNKET